MNPFKETWDLPEVEMDDVPAVVTAYPAGLPHDMACAMSDEEYEVVRLTYALSEQELDYITNRHDYKREYAEWRQRLINEGNSFKLKLRAMSEAYLPQIHDIMHSESTAPSVKSDLFKYITKVAELEPVLVKAVDPSGGASTQQTRMVIQWGDGSGQIAVETKNG